MVCSGCNASLACTVILLVLQQCTSAQQHVGATSASGVRTWRAAREAAGLAQRDVTGSRHVHTQAEGWDAASQGITGQGNCRPQVTTSIEQQSMPEGLEVAMQATGSLPPAEQNGPHAEPKAPNSSKISPSHPQVSNQQLQTYDSTQAGQPQPGWRAAWLFWTHMLCTLWGYLMGRWRSSARQHLPQTSSNSSSSTGTKDVAAKQSSVSDREECSNAAGQQATSNTLSSHDKEHGLQPATVLTTSAACSSAVQPATAVSSHVEVSTSGEATQLGAVTSTTASDAEADSGYQGNTQSAAVSSKPTDAMSQENLHSEALQQMSEGTALHGTANQPAVAAVMKDTDEAPTSGASAVAHSSGHVPEQIAQHHHAEYHGAQQMHQHVPLLLAPPQGMGSASSSTIQQGDMQLQTVLHAAGSHVQLVQTDTTHPQGISLHISSEALARCLAAVADITRPLAELAQDVRHAGVLLKQLSQQVAGSMQLLDQASAYMGSLVNLHHQHSQQALCARCIQLGLLVMTGCLLWTSWHHGRLATLAIVCSQPASSSSNSWWMSSLLRPSTSFTWFVAGVRQLACYTQQMGSFGTGITLVYLTGPLLYSITGRQLASSWQVDIPLVLAGLAGALGVAVVGADCCKELFAQDAHSIAEQAVRP